MFWHCGLLPGGVLTADCRLRTTDGGEFRAQRGFLRVSSPYFRALFAEDNGSPRDVLVSGVTGGALDVLLTFLYTDQLFVSGRNVLDVLQAADMLLLDVVREKCFHVLLRSLAPENCLSIAQLSHRYKDPKFVDTVMAYARENFDEVWRRSDDFGKTPYWLLYDLLASPELNILHEEDALEAIASWHSTAEPRDSSMLLELLRCVRIGCCKRETFDVFRERWPTMAKSADFQEAITEALNLGPCRCSKNPVLLKLREPEKELLQTAHSSLVKNPAAAAAANNPGAAEEAFLALNAVTAAATALHEAAVAAANAVAPAAAARAEADGLAAGTNVQGEPAHSDEDRSKDALPLKQARCGTCGLANPERWLPRLPSELIFVVGGWSKGRAQSTIETFDHRVNRWFQFQSKEVKPRAYHGGVQWRRQVFVIGGLNLAYYLRSVDSFDLDRCKWHHHSPMHVTRAYVATAALGDHIYAIGGHTGVERTRTVERYEPLKNQWTIVAPMNRQRSDGSACVFNGRLFVSGGFNGGHVLESVEVYTPSSDSWSLVQPLPSPRCSHRMVAHCGRLYVIGGFDGRHRLDKVICSENSLPLRWHDMPSLSTPRSTFAVAQLGDYLYVIGGYNGTSLIADVERYAPGDDSWREAKALTCAVGAHSGCTVRGLEVCRKLSARGATFPLNAEQ
ncbi:uncharacterized protein LOC144132686 isoform X1 [Amblyomma americanum]